MKFRFPQRFVVLCVLILLAGAMLGCGAGSNLLAKPGTSTATSTATPSGSSSTPSSPSSPAPAPAPAPAPSIQFAANPVSITAGQSAVLSWNTTNATSVSIQPGSSNLAASGSVTVTPTATTTYAATATGAGGTASATVTVTVTAAPAPAPTPVPTVQFTASPSSITVGQNATLTWSTTNATSVSIQPGGSGLAVSGSTTVTPTMTTTYTLTASGSGGTTTASVTVTCTPAPTLGYAFGHLVIVALENKNYSEVVGNTAAMPYLNSLINQYGSATNFYADTHPSIGNYFMLTAGQIITNDDSYTGTVSADNVVREMLAAGKTFKSYAEDLPYAGYVGGDTGLYIARHNPFTFFSDIRNNSSLAASTILPFSQFATDMAAGQLPQYSFVVPNMNDDAHECPNGINACLAVADAWLKQNMGPLLADANFQKDGVLIVWFDEAEDTDSTNGGGQVSVVFISPAWSKMGYRSSTFYQHENALRFTMDALGVSKVPGAGATAKGMNEFFNAH